MKRKEFSPEAKRKCLLWSDRHCCLCGKFCGPDIEIDHINPKGRNDQDNAIPLCYDCHAKKGSYNIEHPRGTKYKPEELKIRRDQIYERYTRHLVPPIDWQITQLIGKGARERTPLPRVGFNISHLGDFPPAKAKVQVKVFLGYRNLGVIKNPEKPYYSDGIRWNLNPRHMVFGNFGVPTECVESSEDLKLEVKLTIIDIYDRLHELYPVCYTFVRNRQVLSKGQWFTEPTSFNELERFRKEPMKYD